MNSQKRRALQAIENKITYLLKEINFSHELGLIEVPSMVDEDELNWEKEEKPNLSNIEADLFDESEDEDEDEDEDALELDEDAMIEADDNIDSINENNAHNYSHTHTFITRNFFDDITSLQYTQMICVIAIVYELIKTNRTMSLRDVYYSLKHVFNNQSQCDNIILDIGKYLLLRRHEMGIIPSAKGLIAGPISWSFNGISDSSDDNNDDDIVMICADSEGGGALISPKWTATPLHLINIKLNNSHSLPVTHVLVIEKEGIYRRLCEDHFYERSCNKDGTEIVSGAVGSVILVTGCGYPDIATRSCVTKISLKFPSLIIVGVCDYNPYGASLMLCYKQCSMNSRMNYETSCMSMNIVKSVGMDNYGNKYQSHDDDSIEHDSDGDGDGGYVNSVLCPKMKWLGLRNSHFKELESMIDMSAFQYYTKMDYTKINAMIKSFSAPDAKFTSYLHSHSKEKKEVDKERDNWLNELKQMKTSGRKCELEAVYALGIDSISSWIEKCLINREYI
jgi:DNA topoisomerase VI subunit A